MAVDRGFVMYVVSICVESAVAEGGGGGGCGFNRDLRFDARISNLSFRAFSAILVVTRAALMNEDI